MTTSKDGSPSSKPEVLIVAAETSSSLYAQRLLELWKSKGHEPHAFGIGSRQMEQLGFEVIGRSEELAVVGLQEVISHYGKIRKTFFELLKQAEARKPKVALLLDYPDFNLRLAKKLKKMGIPVVYYISPQVWAWRKSRVHLIRKVVDKILVLFPFEEPFYKKNNVPVEFVGHPLLDELNDQHFSDSYRQERRSRYGLGPNELLLGLMPGSRTSELKHHLATQIEVAQRLQKKYRRLKVALFVAPGFDSGELKAHLPQLDFPLITVKDEPIEMINLADIVLCASGTATLFVGLMRKPLVVMYKMNALTAFLARLFVRSTKYFGMINLVLDERVAPEFFQEQASVETLSRELESFIVDPEKRKKVSEKLSFAQARLGNKGATERVAQALTPYLER